MRLLNLVKGGFYGAVVFGRLVVDAPDDDAGVWSGLSVEAEGELGGADEFGFRLWGVAPRATSEEMRGDSGGGGDH